jgi:hypothetical protein
MAKNQKNNPKEDEVVDTAAGEQVNLPNAGEQEKATPAKAKKETPAKAEKAAPAKLSESKLKEQAKDVFARNNVDKLYAITDGTFFLPSARSFAAQYAKDHGHDLIEITK